MRLAPFSDSLENVDFGSAEGVPLYELFHSVNRQEEKGLEINNKIVLKNNKYRLFQDCIGVSIRVDEAVFGQIS